MSRPYLISDEAPVLLPQVGGYEGGTLHVPGFKPRSQNLPHISPIIKDLCIRQGIFKGDREISPEFGELGNTLEFSMASRLHLSDPGRYHQPGELVKDGFAGTPDLIDMDGGPTGRVDEIKMSWATLVEDAEDTKYWRYWVQVKAYCYMWGTNLGGVRVYFVVGDWKGPPDPKYRYWGWNFTDRQLQQNWEMLMRHGQKMIEEGRL